MSKRSHRRAREVSSQRRRYELRTRLATSPGRRAPCRARISLALHPNLHLPDPNLTINPNAHAISDRLSRAIEGYRGLSRAIEGYRGLSRAIRGEASARKRGAPHTTTPCPRSHTHARGAIHTHVCARHSRADLTAPIWIAYRGCYPDSLSEGYLRAQRLALPSLIFSVCDALCHARERARARRAHTHRSRRAVLETYPG
jgi:hypothetical protein